MLIGGLMIVSLATSVQGDNTPSKPVPTHAGWERLKKLAGTWVEADKDGKPTDKVVSVVKVTAAGSAIHETVVPGQRMEMVAGHHLD
jgi:copper(I)-binding protein